MATANEKALATLKERFAKCVTRKECESVHRDAPHDYRLQFIDETAILESPNRRIVARANIAIGNQDSQFRQQPIRDWLREHHARRIDLAGELKAYSIGGRVLIYQDMGEDGWQVYTPVESPKTDETLRVLDMIYAKVPT